MPRPAAAGSPLRGKACKTITVYDCRFENKPILKKLLEIRGLDFDDFLQILNKQFSIRSEESFVVVTTDRTVVDYDKFENLQDGITLYLLQHEKQVLSSATKEIISFVPHFNTLVQSGTSEYYADGQKSLPYALAELVDNSISATAKNSGERKIEIRMLFDKTLGKPAIMVLDNGCGMTSKQLNDWAVYRLSKFQRKGSIYASETKGYVPPDPVPRSLNSDISYFGVGGKHAAFFIGDSVKMITKTANSPDVHEFSLSKEEFERKQKNNEDIYSGIILNRKPCDSSYVRDDEHFLRALIEQETRKNSFTAVVVTGIKTDHITYLKQDFEKWTTELAHVYHYYIHGLHGHDLKSTSAGSESPQKLDIQITLREKPTKCPRVVNLREVETDMQTLYITSAADMFEFSATIPPDQGTVEGIIRYHPFLYDRETYPVALHADKALDCDDDGEPENEAQNQARGKRNVFECYWNGRLIPYTTVSEFDWCSRPAKGGTLPAECYSRFSGVLFTDGKFQVSTNKLHFMELELKLKCKDTIFTPIVNAQKISKRGNIQKEFHQWLQNCHEKYDKQVKFMGYIETITRPDQSKKMQHPWATFFSIQWGSKIYKAGQLIKSQRTQFNYYGTIVRFLLHGSYDGDVFATGGQVEICREPKALYNSVKIIPISKIDQTASLDAIKKSINTDMDKLPANLNVKWPEDNVWPQDSVWPVGTPFGPLRVEVQNRKGDSLSRIQTGGNGPGIRMSIRLVVVHHGSTGDEEIVCLSAPFLPNYGHWFKKIETLTKLGKYTMTLNTTLFDSNITVYGGQELPSYKLNFSLKEGDAESFTVATMNPTVRVGVPFNIPLQITDCYGHSTAPPPKIQPVLKSTDLVLSQGTLSCTGTLCSIKGVKARGKIQQSKSYDLAVTLPGLRKDTRIVKITLLPGNPHSLHVKPKPKQFQIENGNPATFNVEVHDEAGNITANSKQIVTCQVSGLPFVSTDCSSTGAGQLVTKPIKLKIINGQSQKLNVEFEMPSQKHVEKVTMELEVLPSSQVSAMELYCEGDGNLVLKNNEKIEWQAGGHLENLFYRLYDESHREVPITAAIASMIKVNWTGDIDQADLIVGRLPDVQVPTQVQEERFYQVSYHNQSVSFSFTIVPCPDEPARLKVTLPQSTVRLGENLSGHILLKLVDQFDNVSNRLTPACVKSMTVEAEGLDKSRITFKWQGKSSSIFVTGVHFSSGPPGPRELRFSYDGYEGCAIVTVAPGVPAQLKLISGPEQPLQVLNGHSITTPFLIQLCDDWGNPSPDQRVVVEVRPSPATLKVKSVISQPVDAEGKARFNVNAVIGLKGYYQLEFRSVFNRQQIPGPVVNLTVIPDSNKPVRLAVEYDTEARYLAGDIFPVFSVTVVSEEGSPMTKFPPSALYMSVWKEESSAIPLTTPEQLRCSKPMEHDRNDRYYFRDKEIPREVGKYFIQFSLHIDKAQVMHSNQISINVLANTPVKLGPDLVPAAPVVSYSMDISKRTLINNMALNLMDAFGNPAGQNLNGKILVSIRSSNGETSNSVPLFESNNKSIQIDLEEGKACINRLAIMEKSPGEDGSTYMLVFEPEVPMFPASLEPFELPFYFNNDAENQQKMSELTKKRDDIVKTIDKINESLGFHAQLKDLYAKKVQDEEKKELYFRNELKRRNMAIMKPLPSSDIATILTRTRAEASTLEKRPRRVCTIPNTFTHPDVLGMVAHLAFVEDDEAARVISWHLRGDMDCIITRTTAAALSIFSDTQGRQQVMALDSIHVQQGDRPLPHMRNDYNLFDPRGNPVYAKDLLIHPFEREKCEIVFKNLLGDTIVMDDLESATEYRRAVVENRRPCPTILTRQGDRVSSKGKFGGAQNKAPPIKQLKVFGAPLPPHYYILKAQIEMLTQYGSFKKKMEGTITDRDAHVKDTPEILRAKQNLEQKKEELENINRQLALASARPGKRGPGNPGEPSGIFTKKPRQSFT